MTAERIVRDDWLSAWRECFYPPQGLGFGVDRRWGGYISTITLPTACPEATCCNAETTSARG